MKCCTLNCCTFPALILAFFAMSDAEAQSTLESSENSQDASTRYVLSIDKGALGSHEIRHGEYALAIDLISRRNGVEDDLSAQHSLCVAHIALQQFDDATIACQAASELADNIITTARNPHGHKNREGIAKAQSNLAVLQEMMDRRLADNAASETDTSNTQSVAIADSRLARNRTTDRRDRN